MHPKIMRQVVAETNKPISVQITPQMVTKCLKSLPRANAYVQMATMAEAMHWLAMENTADRCIDDARAACHEFIDRIFNQAEDDIGF